MGIDPKMLPEVYRKQIHVQSRITPAPVAAQDAKPEPDALQAVVLRHEDETPSVGRTRVCITRRSTGTLDEDNLHGSVKSLLDGLQKAGLIRSDSQEDIKLEVKQERVKTRKEQGTLLEITDL